MKATHHHEALQTWTRTVIQNNPIPVDGTVTLATEMAEDSGTPSPEMQSIVRFGSKNPPAITLFSLQVYLYTQLTDGETKTRMKGFAGVTDNVAVE